MAVHYTLEYTPIPEHRVHLNDCGFDPLGLTPYLHTEDTQLVVYIHSVWLKSTRGRVNDH